MSERVTTQYPTGEALVLTAPYNEPASLDALLAASATITALAARVTALENAASTSTTTSSGTTGSTA